jgi:hypothetical protein
MCEDLYALLDVLVRHRATSFLHGHLEMSLRKAGDGVEVLVHRGQASLLPRALVLHRLLDFLANGELDGAQDNGLEVSARKPGA